MGHVAAHDIRVLFALELMLYAGHLSQPGVWGFSAPRNVVSAQVVLERARIGRSRNNLEDFVSCVPRAVDSKATEGSLKPQRHERIHSRRAPCGHIASQDRYHQQHGRRHKERGCVGRARANQ